jgi:hypothetical protein
MELNTDKPKKIIIQTISIEAGLLSIKKSRLRDFDAASTETFVWIGKKKTRCLQFRDPR